MRGVEWRVMAHPDRRVLAEALAKYLGGIVVYDPDPGADASAWRTARKAWSIPTRRTHVGVMQDDAVPCPGFRPRAKALIAAHPDCLVSFYLGHKHASARGYLKDRDEGEEVHHLTWGHFVPTLALAMPAAYAIEVAKQEPGQRFDDEVIGRWRTAHGIDAIVPIPPLVEHSTIVPSLMWTYSQPRHAAATPA